MEYLERRHCEYDQKTLVDFYKEGDASKPAVTGVIGFTSTPDKVSNKYYLGPAPLEDLARQIATAHGLCGNNREYLFLLEKAIAEQEGIKVKPIELSQFVDFFKFNKLWSESFFIGPNQYLVTSIHENWFCARCMNTAKPAGEGAIVIRQWHTSWLGCHEDDYVIELASEVRKVLGISGIGIPKERKLVGSPLTPLMSHVTPFQLRSLPEAIVMDSS